MNVIGSKFKLLWERITFSKLTTIYFVFSVAHCFIQVIFQIQAFTINDQAAIFLYSVLSQGNATDPNGFTVLTANDLRLCDSVPNTLSASSCRVLWNGTVYNDNVLLSSNGNTLNSSFATALGVAANGASTSGLALTPVPSATFSSTLATSSAVSNSSSTSTSSQATATSTSTKVDVNNAAAATVASKTTTTLFATSTTIITTVHVEDDGDDDDDEDDDDLNDSRRKRSDANVAIIAATDLDGEVSVKINGLGYDNEDVLLDRSCLWALNYPVGILLNTKREDITFIAFQFWVLGMSTVALLNESIPHIIASLLTHMLATAWAGFQIAHTADFKANFSRVATNGACHPINLLPGYWKERGNAELPILALNVAALFVSAFLTWRLIKLFGWQTFKRVGASMTINRVYKIVLTLSIVIQLSLFFMVVTIALWIDQLWNGQIAHLAILAHVYKPVFIVVLVLLLPWLATGWFAVRRELRIPMLVFLVLSFGYLAGWGAMFASTTFRWTFVQWRFFSLIASGGALLTLISSILGLVCRVNFGKGLLRYLSAQEPIPDETIPDPFMSPTENKDVEKVDFPTDSIPSFSVAFGTGDEVPLPNQMFAGRQRGPRFFKESEEPFEGQEDAREITAPPTYRRSPSSGSISPERDNNGRSLTRQNTSTSDRSVGSTRAAVARNNSQSSQASSTRSKRWVIE